MKKRTAFIGAILSLIPFGQPLLFKTGVIVATAKIVIFNSDWAIAESAEFYYKRGNDKYDAEDYKGAIKDYTKATKLIPEDGDLYMDIHFLKLSLEDFKGAVSARNKSFEL